MREATVQSGYDGAAIVYARNQALAYQRKSDPLDHASVITFTTNGNQVTFYAHYAAETEDGSLQYHQYPVSSMNLTKSHPEHKEGRRGLRNAQDLAKEQSYALKNQLKDHYEQQLRRTLCPLEETVPPLPVSDDEPLVTIQTYTDEDDYKVVETQSIYQPTPPIPSKSKNGQKRKAPSSQGPSSGSSHHSKYKSYWKKDTMSGRYYHKHSDGSVSWLDSKDCKKNDSSRP
ncbi:hypothetical protein MCOR25_005884 [Pyricularia grisea]|nr:hypothetical protein MCOR25_005884 [Pyricularia grisea]